MGVSLMRQTDLSNIEKTAESLDFKILRGFLIVSDMDIYDATVCETDKLLRIHNISAFSVKKRFNILRHFLHKANAGFRARPGHMRCDD